MGIEAKYRRVSPDDWKRLQTDKKFANSFFGTGGGIKTIAAALRAFKKLMEQNIDAPETDVIGSSVDSAQADNILDIGKDWQALHFLLTGEFCFSGESKTPPPLSNVIMGGTETKWKAVYGKIRVLSQAEVNAVAEALSGISRAKLRPRLDYKRFNQHKVYPAYEHWDAAQTQALLDVCDQVKAFFSKAAKKGELVLISFD